MTWSSKSISVVKKLLLPLSFRLFIVFFFSYLSVIIEPDWPIPEPVHYDFGCVDDDGVSRLLKTTVKAEAGQMMSAQKIGAPHSLLYKRFPSWREDNKTYMIPPIFKPGLSAGRSDIEVKGPVVYSDPGEIGENTVYKLLRQLGETRNMGMFVFHNFKLKDISGWNKKKVMISQEVCRLPDLPPEMITKECDFIVFHHSIGVIAIEVKNPVEKVRNKHVRDAEGQLDTSYDLVRELATSCESTIGEPATQSETLVKSTSSQQLSLPYQRVVALPSITKSSFNREEFKSLGDHTHVLLADELSDVKSFEKWWKETMDEPARIDRKQYELALSYLMMIRHLTPVKETDCLKELHEKLVSYKYHGTVHELITEKEFPRLFEWCSSIMTDVPFQIDKEEAKRLRDAFMKQHGIEQQKDLRGRKVMKIINRMLEHQKYIGGEIISPIDLALVVAIENSHFLFLKELLEFMRMMQKQWSQIGDIEESQLELQKKKLPFLKLESPKHFNMLGKRLRSSTFIEDGKMPTEIDKHIFHSLSCKMRLDYLHFPMVMTTEQLVVFEGPQKQLIIGPPGSGKTELLKFKALELEAKMKICKSQKRILFIVGNGSPKPQYQDSLLFHKMKEFFSSKKSFGLVDVVSISLEEESPTELEETKRFFREQMDKYEHVFLDEYWIGSKPPEHEIILELLDNIEGYVWISSVFDYNESLLKTKQKMQIRTKPLLDTLSRVGGVVSRISQASRGTDSIIELEASYSALYQSRSYPYGTREILGHSLEGLPVSWIVESGVQRMYSKCVEIVDTYVHDIPGNLILSPSDILVVDFATRSHESLGIQPLSEQLKNKEIPVWTFGETPYIPMTCKNLTLLNSVTRDDSSYLDGVEWPMVIVILPSGLVLETEPLAESKNAEKLRNYDPYISFFRSMVKLVIISDKWTNSKSFLSDVKHKLSK